MEQKFQKVREQLDDLGYIHVLLPEALPLVEKLVADLIHTTESLQRYKKTARDALEEQNNLQLGAEPYKCDNAKLVRECNELHLAFLQVREQSDKIQKELKKRVSTLETQKNDCEVECEELRKRIRTLEFESAKKTDRLLSVHNKKPKSAKSDSAAVKFKPRTEISSAMALADQKIASLSKEIQKLKDERLQLIELNDTYKCQLNNRDKEIERLSQMLEGGRPIDALNRDCCYRDVERKLTQMKIQIDSLENEKSDLENQLKDAVAKQHEAMKRAVHLAEKNKQLGLELKELDQMALAVEADCNSTVKMNAEKVSRLQERTHEMAILNQSLEREISEHKRDKQQLAADLDGLKLEKRNLQSILETALEDKKRLNDRINQLTVIEHDLNLEIDKLVQNSANQKRKIAELECKLLSDKFDSVTDFLGGGDAITALDRIKAERDYYMKEYRTASEQLKHLSVKSPNDLVQKLQESQEAIETLRHETKVLAQEKHSLMTRLEGTRDNYSETDYEGFSLKSCMRKLERERDILKGDVQRLEEERDALRQRLKTVTDTQTQERSKMEKMLMESQTQMRQLEMEHRELAQAQGSRRAAVSNLEQQCDCLKSQLQCTQTELCNQKTLYNQLKNLHEHTDRALTESKSQLSEVENRLSKSNERIQVIDKEKTMLEEQVNTLQGDIQIIKGSLHDMDREKDGLLLSVDDKTEKVAKLEKELRAKEEKIRSLEATVTDLKRNLNIMSDSVASKEGMLRSVSSESTSLQQELQQANRKKEAAIQENKRLQSDLAATATDLRCTCNELEQCKRQVEDLKRQLQFYVMEVKRFEDLMSQKELERTDLLDQFKNLSEEAMMLESNNHTLESEATQSKVQLSVTLGHVQDLETKLESQENLISNYETQITDLKAQIAKMEYQLCHCKQQQERTDAELSSMRDLCMKLDKQKDTLRRELSEKDDLKVQMDNDISRIRSETENLHANVTRDRMTVENLEKLLSEARQETVQQKLYNDELETEVRKLRTKMEELHQKLSPGGNVTLQWTSPTRVDEPNKELKPGPCCACQKGFDAEPYRKPNTPSTPTFDHGLKPYRKDSASSRSRREEPRSTRYEEHRDETEWLSHRQRSPVSRRDSIRGSTVELCPAMPSSGVCHSTCGGLCKSACDASVNTEFTSYHEAVSTDRLHFVDEASDVETDISNACEKCRKCKCSKLRKTSI